MDPSSPDAHCMFSSLASLSPVRFLSLKRIADPTSSLEPVKEAFYHWSFPTDIHVSSNKHFACYPLIELTKLYSGLGASIARMVQYIQVETGGDPALFSDLQRK